MDELSRKGFGQPPGSVQPSLRKDARKPRWRVFALNLTHGWGDYRFLGTCQSQAKTKAHFNRVPTDAFETQTTSSLRMTTEHTRGPHFKYDHSMTTSLEFLKNKPHPPKTSVFRYKPSHLWHNLTHSPYPVTTASSIDYTIVWSWHFSGYIVDSIKPYFDGD